MRKRVRRQITEHKRQGAPHKPRTERGPAQRISKSVDPQLLLTRARTLGLKVSAGIGPTLQRMQINGANRNINHVSLAALRAAIRAAPVGVSMNLAPGGAPMSDINVRIDVNNVQIGAIGGGAPIILQGNLFFHVHLFRGPPAVTWLFGNGWCNDANGVVISLSSGDLHDIFGVGGGGARQPMNLLPGSINGALPAGGPVAIRNQARAAIVTAVQELNAGNIVLARRAGRRQLEGGNANYFIRVTNWANPPAPPNYTIKFMSADGQEAYASTTLNMAGLPGYLGPLPNIDPALLAQIS